MKTSLPAQGAEPAMQALVVMGVSGSGKSDISRAVASALGLQHIEADLFHPDENVQRMSAGIALSDENRKVWLDALIAEMQAVQASGNGFVLACSALKNSYREQLRAAIDDLHFAHLEIDHATALKRVGARPGHFMPTSLVDSQFATLESPANESGVLTVDASQSREAVVAAIVSWAQHNEQRLLAESVDHSAEFDSANNAESAQSVNEQHEGARLTGEPIYTGGVALMFDKITDMMMAALMAFMVIVVFSNVVLRYAFGTGWAGAEELSRLAFVWLVFVGVASSMRRGELMSFTLIRDRFPHLMRKLIDSLSWLLVAAASALSVKGAWEQMQYGWSNTSPVVGYPLAIAMLPVLASMAVLVLLAMVQLVNVWRRDQSLANATANVTID
ncbi:gluconokinase [Pseudomonas segetis]|uniref:Multifunctional fusion protein n=2 Tax=Pseudomonas segetis TaxID=298908 RepID=A0A239IV36_9PSED|nr:gluconokinase [Pseudomonas segetis]